MTTHGRRKARAEFLPQERGARGKGGGAHKADKKALQSVSFQGSWTAIVLATGRALSGRFRRSL